MFIYAIEWGSDSEEEREKAEEETTSDEELRAEMEEEMTGPEKKKRTRHMGSLDNVLELAARREASESDTAAWCNAVHRDDGIDLDANPHLIVTKSKVHKAKVRYLTKLSNAPVPSTDCLFFDGKRYDTMHSEKVDEHFQRTVLKNDDHYAISDGRSEEFLGEVVVDRGTGEQIAESLIEFVETKQGLELDDITMIGADSTNVNTGSVGGAIAIMEEKLGRPVHRFICIFHIAELLLRHLVKYWIGDTDGPKSFSSAMGKELVNLKSPTIANFKKIDCPDFPVIPDDVLKVEAQLFLYHSSDQRGRNRN